jgi:hypothetical protein
MKKKDSKTANVSAKVKSGTKKKIVAKAKRLRTTPSKVVADTLEKNI